MNLLNFSNQQLYVSNLFIIVKTNDVKQKKRTFARKNRKLIGKTIFY